MLFAVENTSEWQVLITGLSYGCLIALIALGYSMVYGIIGLINFAHGDVFMLGAFLCWTILGALYPNVNQFPADQGIVKIILIILLLVVAAGTFCAAVNMSIDRLIYRPLRRAPKLAPLVSAIGVSFILVNIGQLWGGVGDITVRPENVISKGNVLDDYWLLKAIFAGTGLQLTYKDLLLFSLVIPTMLLLTWLVKMTKLGKAMRAVQQNPTAAELMGIPVEQVIAATFAIGGALAGAASVIDVLTRGTNNFQMGYQFGLYAFTAAILGGIGSIPGAVLGGVVIGLIRAMTQTYLNAQWSNAIIFGILVVILVFKPAGLLGRNVREKV